MFKDIQVCLCYQKEILNNEISKMIFKTNDANAVSFNLPRINLLKFDFLGIKQILNYVMEYAFPNNIPLM